jgi:multidrug resistance efflux pump
MESKAPAFIRNSPLGKRLAAAQGRSRILIPVFILVVLGLVIGGISVLSSLVNGEQAVYSGTIEATDVHLGTESGGRVDVVNVQEGDKVRYGQVLAVVHGDFIRSPIDGVVLERAIEPGEVASVGSTILSVTNLDELRLTVYVPEDRYGKFLLGQACRVTVDSFPGEAFSGTVTHIADQAEFTPRNVQTVDSRKNTVFAIRFDLAPSGGKLKPGMPADVSCDFGG